MGAGWGSGGGGGLVVKGREGWVESGEGIKCGRDQVEVDVGVVPQCRGKHHEVGNMLMLPQ